MTKRKPIGRTLNTASLLDKATLPLNEKDKQQTFILHSGNKAHFYLTQIAADKIEEMTYVNTATNGREQAALTAVAVSDISRTLHLHQFFPAIGCKRADGRIEILDGSRRRAAAIFIQTSLTVLVTEDQISADDARQLAKDIQTAREHNLREIGMHLLSLRESGMNQKEIAESQGLSEAKVTRAIQAASVPAILLTLFPIQAELTHSEYKLLLNIARSLDDQAIALQDLVEKVAVKQQRLDTQIPHEDYKNATIKLYREAAKMQLAANDKKATVKVDQLWHFTDKDSFARRKEKERGVSYEFNRLPKSVIQALDDAVNEVLFKHLK